MNNRPWIIIQAGGLGTRLRPKTNNIPKCLVPVLGETILSNAIKIFDDDKMIVIGDYKFDVLENYINIFYPKVKLIKTDKKGTCSGIKDALQLITDNSPIIIVWSDLYFLKKPIFDFKKRTLGLSRTFNCRYQYINHQYIKETNNNYGIAGFFCFPNKEEIEDIYEEESLVSKYLKNKEYKFDNFIWLDDVHEIGTLQSLKEFEQDRARSRFFNNVTIENNKVIKVCNNKFYNHLLENEKKWYNKVNSLGIKEVPKLLNEQPFEIEFRNGKHPYKLDSDEKKGMALKAIFNFFNEIHKYEIQPSDQSEIKKMYFDKTNDRVFKYLNLINCRNEKSISINEKIYDNILFNEKIKKLYSKIKCENFCLYHGDLTFSNCLWDEDKQQINIFDPRAKFGDLLLVGDPCYDWAKVYYSAVDGYDITNLRDYEILFEDNKYIIPDKNQYLEKIFWDICPFSKEQILLRVGFIWLSLIGYLENDIESMNLAFLKACKIFGGLDEII